MGSCLLTAATISAPSAASLPALITSSGNPSASILKLPVPPHSIGPSKNLPLGEVSAVLKDFAHSASSSAYQFGNQGHLSLT